MRASSPNITMHQGVGDQLQGGRTTPGIVDPGEARTRKRGNTTSLRVRYGTFPQRCANADRGVDDLPVIRENLRKGFFETQSKVNSWVTNLKKRIDGEDVDEQSSQHDEQSSAYGRPRRSGDLGRRSGDRERYDADPQVLGDDFSALELRDSEGELIHGLIPFDANISLARPPPPPRPLADSSLKKSSSPSPDRRKVSFQDGPPTEIDANRDASGAKRTPSTGGKSSKWQPLATVEPSPVAENDPFSLGDSDDEKDAKAKEQTTVAESEQLKKDTADAMSGEMGSSQDKSKTEGSSK